MYHHSSSPTFLTTSLLASFALPSLSQALELTTTTFSNITAGDAFNVSWEDASGDVSFSLLYSGAEINVATNLKSSPYLWTPAHNLSDGMYQASISDGSDDQDISDPFVISGGIGLGKPNVNGGITPPSNVAGAFNHTLLDGDDDDDFDDFDEDGSDLSRGAIIGVSIGAAGALIIILLLMTLVWTYRKKYIDTMTRYGDLLREIYGDDQGRQAVVIDIMTPIPDVSEEEERDEEGERKEKERQEKIREQELRIRRKEERDREKMAQVEAWRREDEERAVKEERGKDDNADIGIGSDRDSVGTQLEEWRKDEDAKTLMGSDGGVGKSV